jgi:hypothetical protein
MEQKKYKKKPNWFKLFVKVNSKIRVLKTRSVETQQTEMGQQKMKHISHTPDLLNCKYWRQKICTVYIETRPHACAKFLPQRRRVHDGWVSGDCCLKPSEHFFSYIIARASYISMRWWWCPLCTRPTREVLFW